MVPNKGQGVVDLGAAAWRRFDPARRRDGRVVPVYDPPRKAVMRGTSSSAPFEATLTFEPADGGTRVEAVTEVFLRGPARLFAGMFTGWYGRKWDLGLETLKTMMESGEL